MSFYRLGEILPQALAGLGIRERVRLERIARAWPVAARALSEPLAAQSAVVALEGATLTVEVTGEEAAAFVATNEAALLAGLCAETGDDDVTRIHVRRPASGDDVRA